MFGKVLGKSRDSREALSCIAIEGGAHFPWIEIPQAVQQAFSETRCKSGRTLSEVSTTRMSVVGRERESVPGVPNLQQSETIPPGGCNGCGLP